MPNIKYLPERYSIKQELRKSYKSIDYIGYDKIIEKELFIKYIPKDSMFYDIIFNDFMMLFQFKHPNLIEVIDFGILDEEGLYYVMPFYEKIDLIKSIKKEGISFFLEVFFQLLCGLHFLHQRQKIHGNLNPNNVIISKENNKIRVRIGDYGIVSSIKPQDLIAKSKYQNYFAPELFHSNNAKFTRYSDYYSLGVILFKLLFNKLPTEEFFIIYEKNLTINENMMPLIHVDEGIIKIIFKLLNKNPNLRYQNSQQILSDLMPFLKKYNIEEKKESFIWKNVLKEIRKNKQIELKFYGEKIIKDILEKITKDFSENKRINLSVIMASNSLDTSLIADYIYYTYKHDNIPIVRIKEMNNKTLSFYINSLIKNNIPKYLLKNDNKKILLIENCKLFVSYQDEFFEILQNNRDIKIIIGMDNNNCVLKKAITGVKINYHKVKKLSISEVKEYLKMYFGYGVLPPKMEEYLLFQSNRDLKILNQYIDYYIENDIILYRNLKWYFRMELFDENKMPEPIENEIVQKIDKINEELLYILAIITFWKRQFTVKELNKISGISILKLDTRINILKSYQLVLQGRKFYSLYFPFLRANLEKYLPNTIKQNALNKISSYLESKKQRDIDEEEILFNIYLKLKKNIKLLERAEFIINNTEETIIKERILSIIFSNKEQLEIYDKTKMLILLLSYAWLLIDTNRTDKALIIYSYLSEKINKNDNGRLQNLFKILHCHFLLNKGQYNQIINEINKLQINNLESIYQIRVLIILSKTYDKLKKFDEEKKVLEKIIRQTQYIKKQDLFITRTKAIIDLAMIEKRNGETQKAFDILNKINLKNKKNPALSILVYSHLARLDIRMNKISLAEKHLKYAENILNKNDSSLIDTGLFWKVKSFYLFLTGNYWQSLLCNNNAFIQFKKNNIFNFNLFAFKLIILLRMGFLKETKNLIKEIQRQENLNQTNQNNLKIFLAYISFKEDNKFEEPMNIMYILKQKMILPNDYFYQHFLYLVKKEDYDTLDKVEKFINSSINQQYKKNPQLIFMTINFYYATNRINKTLSILKKLFKINLTAIDNSEYINLLAYKIKKEAFQQNITIDDYKKYLKKARLIVQRKYDLLPNDDFKSRYMKEKVIKEIIYYYKVDIVGSVEIFYKSDFLDTIEEMTKIISKITDKRKLFYEILKLAIKASKMERGVIYTFDDNNDQFKEEYLFQFSKDSLDSIKDFIKETVYGVIKTKKFVYFTKASELPVDIKSVICIPLIVYNNVIGVIYLDSYNIVSLKPEEIKFLNIFAHIAGSALETSDNYNSLVHEKEHLSLLMKTPEMNYDVGIIGNSAAMQEVYRNIEKISKTNVNVLIQGESGTGKELVAKAIYKLSNKSDKPFIPVDCGSLSNDIIESELFGYVKGAFTGAMFDKKGIFEEVNGGTIFLDEISNISLSMQAKLLRVIQEGEIKRIGENTLRKIDVRIIAASNIDLKELVKAGTFREDLYFRLSTFPIFIPPLRERKEDIKVLASYFLNHYSKKHKKNIIGFSEDAYKIMYKYNWPGNVRELKNELERAVILYNGNKRIIGASYFEHLTSNDLMQADQDVPIGNFHDLLDEYKIKLIENAYIKSGKNWTNTAKLLNISRQNLNQIYKRLKKKRLTKQAEAKNEQKIKKEEF